MKRAQPPFNTTMPNPYLMRVAPLQRVEYRIEAALPDAAARHQARSARKNAPTLSSTTP
jgi:hypothetical protein